jgi:hypothetical protein
MRKKKLLKKYTQTYDIVVSEKKNWIIWRGAHRRETYKIYNEKKKSLYAVVTFSLKISNKHFLLVAALAMASRVVYNVWRMWMGMSR